MKNFQKGNIDMFRSNKTAPPTPCLEKLRGDLFFPGAQPRIARSRSLAMTPLPIPDDPFMMDAPFTVHSPESSGLLTLPAIMMLNLSGKSLPYFSRQRSSNASTSSLESKTVKPPSHGPKSLNCEFSSSKNVSSRSLFS